MIPSDRVAVFLLEDIHVCTYVHVEAVTSDSFLHCRLP